MMIGTLLIVCLVASTFAASSGPNCVEEGLAMKSELTPGYIKQVNKILNCNEPKFYVDCFDQSEPKWPRNLDSVIEIFCNSSDVASSDKFISCFMQPEELITMIFKPFSYFSCSVNVLRSEEEGFLCAEYKRLGADVVSKILPTANQSLASASQFLKSKAPPNMTDCVTLIPTTTLEAIDLICNRLGTGTKERKCFEKLGYTGNSLRSVGNIGGICFALLFNIFALSKLLLK